MQDSASSSADLLASLRAAQLGDDFWITQFKVLPCPHGYRHSWTHCPFAHSGETARRRCPKTHSYGPDVCPAIKSKRPCPNGDACPYAHNTFEQWLHPSRYRTRLCYLGSNCRRPTCFFAHTVEELRHVPSESEGGMLGASHLLTAEFASLPPALLAPPPALSSSGVSAPLPHLPMPTSVALNALPAARPDLFQPAEVLSAPLLGLPAGTVVAQSPLAVSFSNSTVNASLPSAMTVQQWSRMRSPSMKASTYSSGQIDGGLELPRHTPLPTNRAGLLGAAGSTGPNSGPLSFDSASDSYDSNSASRPSSSGQLLAAQQQRGASSHNSQSFGLPMASQGLIVIGSSDAEEGAYYQGHGGPAAERHDQAAHLNNLLKVLRSRDSGPSSGPLSQQDLGRGSPDVALGSAAGPSRLSQHERSPFEQQPQQQQLSGVVPQSPPVPNTAASLVSSAGELQADMEALLPLLQNVLSQGLASGQLVLVDGQLQIKGKQQASSGVQQQSQQQQQERGAQGTQ